MIVPVRDTEAYLKKCLESIIESLEEEPALQAEILVISDASSGEAREITASMRPAFERIRFLENRCQEGLLRTRLRGVRESEGRYLAFVDSDDYVSPGFFGALYRKALEEDADIVIGRTVREEDGASYFYGLHEAFLPHRTLPGEEARRRFFRQEGHCYAWHTIWNKLYRRELWDHLAAWMRQHRPAEVITMNEDLCLSTMLFAMKPVTACAMDEPYHYCVRKGAQTDTAGDSGARILSKISQVQAALSTAEAFLDDLLRKDGEREAILGHFAGCRAYYAGIWRGILRSAVLTPAQRVWAEETAVKIGGGVPGTADGAEETGYCESIRIPYTGRTAYLRRRICQGPEKTVSMDIFGTLVTRPFLRPQDLFLLLDDAYTAMTGSRAPFHVFREEAERSARARAGRLCGYEDVTIREIYEELGRLYGISKDICARMLEEECRLEVLCAAPRESGQELLRAAVRSGRRVVLVTDMYLPRECLAEILSKCGIRGWSALYISAEERRLKSTGHLFEAVCRREGIPASGLLHVGDSWAADIEGARKAHVASVYLPDTGACASGKVEGREVGERGTLGTAYFGRRAADAALRNLACRCARALWERTCYDDPYRDLAPGRGGGGDPFFLGYCLLGPFLLGCLGKIQAYGAQTAVFLARDTDLLYMAALRLQAHGLFRPEVRTACASRDMLLPFMVSEEDAFAAMPVEWSCHSPLSLRKLLERIDRDPQTAVSESARPFGDREEMMRFLQYFRKHHYSRQKHLAEYDRYRKYYQWLPEDAVLVDVGYSGRIPEALSNLCGRPLPFLYLLGDPEDLRRMRELPGEQGTISRQGEILLPYADPRIGPALEYLLAGEEDKCVDIDGNLRPVFAHCPESVSSGLLRSAVREAALSYVEDWCAAYAPLSFRDLPDLSEAGPALLDVLADLRGADRAMLRPASIEDLVYAGNAAVPLEEILGHMHRAEGREEVRDPAAEREAIRAKVRGGIHTVRRGAALLRRDPAGFMKKCRIKAEALAGNGREGV